MIRRDWEASRLALMIKIRACREGDKQLFVMAERLSALLGAPEKSVGDLVACSIVKPQLVAKMFAAEAKTGSQSVDSKIVTEMGYWAIAGAGDYKSPPSTAADGHSNDTRRSSEVRAWWIAKFNNIQRVDTATLMFSAHSTRRRQEFFS